MIIMGIDPGVAATGYGVLEAQNNNLSLIAYGCIKTKSDCPFPQRLSIIYNELKHIINKYHPYKIAIETIYFAKNVKTAMKVAEARGVSILVAGENGAQILEFTPLQVKQSLTGYGRATKSQIQQMVKNTLNLEKIPRPVDAADALAIAITCVQTKSWEHGNIKT